MKRMQGLKLELEKVEGELDEAFAGREEAEAFGDDELAAEFAAAESRLQVCWMCCQLCGDDCESGHTLRFCST